MQVENFHTIRTFYDTDDINRIKKLPKKYQMVIYYLQKAMKPLYQVCLFQFCKYPYVISNFLNIINFINEPTKRIKYINYFIFLFSNYGPYSGKTGKLVTPLDYDISREELIDLYMSAGLRTHLQEIDFLFDSPENFVVSGDIEKSGSHFYEITNEEYDNISTEEQENTVNVFYYKIYDEVKSVPYSVDGICSNYILKTVKTLNELNKFMLNNDFQQNQIDSLEYLIQSFVSGSENDFKEHQKIWIKVKDLIDYTIGFIETYDDPMNKIGTIQGDINIIDPKKNSIEFQKLLMKFEKELPTNPKHKRSPITPYNVQIAKNIFSVGSLGPMYTTSAYNLPNYNDISQKIGSKQIIYEKIKPFNPQRSFKIFLNKTEQKIYTKYSPDRELEREIVMCATILHETLGHASGFNEPKVTDSVKRENAGPYFSGLEEMRAEIMALYCCMVHMKEIINSDFFSDEIKNIIKNIRENNENVEKIFEYIAFMEIVGRAITRWQTIPPNTTEIKEAHTQGNTGILYYFLDNGIGKIIQEDREIDGKNINTLQYNVDFDEENINKIMVYLKKLVINVQNMSSSADGELIKNFFEKYCISTRNPNYSTIVNNMNRVSNMGIEQSCRLFIDISCKSDNLTFKQPEQKKHFEYIKKFFYETYA